MDGSQGLADDQQQEMTPEQQAADKAADADFAAAYDNARSDEPSTVGTTTSSADEAAAPADGGTQGNNDHEHVPDTGAPAATAPNDDDAPVVLTKRQLAELTGSRDIVMTLQNELRQVVNTTNGRFGSMQQMLKEVKEQASHGIRPSFEFMESLEEDFPELAGSIKRDLTKIFGRGNETRPEGEGQQQAAGDASGAAAPGAAQALNPLEAPEVRAALREANLAIVDARHDGWRQFPATPDWQAWQNQLPPVARELLNTTSDATTLSEALDDFKAYRQRAAAATSASNQRGKRLEHAVPATTGSSGAVRSTMSDDDAFEAGFTKAARR